MNPLDPEDKALVEAARNLAAPSDLDASVREFTDRMALLLKHDWERAKRETHSWLLRGNEPRRVPYCEYKCAVYAPTPSIPKARPRFVLAGYFVMLSFSAGIIFFLAAGLTEPFQTLVKIFNDSKADKPIIAWLHFVLWSILCGSMWSAAYLWFKVSEKNFSTFGSQNKLILRSTERCAIKPCSAGDLHIKLPHKWQISESS